MSTPTPSERRQILWDLTFLCWDRPKEGEGSVVTVTKGLSGLGWICPNEDGVRMRQGQCKVMQLALNSADHTQSFAKIHLCMPRRMAQRNKDLFRPAFLLTHIIRNNRDPAREPMLVAQSGMNALRGMALLLDPGSVLFEDLVDDRNERVELRADRSLRPLIPRRR